MQALCLLPDDPNIPLIEYSNNKDLFSCLANQSLPSNWRLQIEKLGSQVAQPCEIPQFHHAYSRTTSVEVKSDQVAFANKEKRGVNLYTMCEKRSVDQFRPQGRLITTLYEHKNPVNALTVTENQDMFFTASRADGVIHGWDTKDTYEEHTSHSIIKMEFENQQINALCSLQNSQYLGVAGSSGMSVVEFRKENEGIMGHKVVKQLS